MSDFDPTSSLGGRVRRRRFLFLLSVFAFALTFAAAFPLRLVLLLEAVDVPGGKRWSTLFSENGVTVDFGRVMPLGELNSLEKTATS
jgi:hypothetical protein